MDAGATGIFSDPKIARSGSMPPAAPAGPSEYTRMFQSPGTGAASAHTVQQAPKVEKQPETQEKPAEQKKVWPLVIVLAVLALAGVSLLLYFLMRR